jgi:hypothetical protein
MCAAALARCFLNRSRFSSLRAALSSSAPAAPPPRAAALTPPDWQSLYASGGDVFTLAEPNANLLRWLAAFDGRTGGGALRACVPLCGRSADLALLAARPRTAVLGIDAAAAALERWGAEHGGLAPPAGPAAAAARASLRYPALRLLRADVFALPRPLFPGAFDLVWDRGGWTAVEPHRRHEYLAILAGMLAPPSRAAPRGGALLLEALVCNLPLAGALHSAEQALRALRAAGLHAAVVAHRDVRDEYPQAAQLHGLQALHEVAVEAHAEAEGGRRE